MSDNLNFTWHWSPFTMLGLLLLCILYTIGLRVAGRNKTHPPLETRRLVAFISAIALIALMLLTPIDMIARTQLFVAHMLQVVVLVTLCSPLLLYACPPWLVQPVIDSRVMRPIVRVVTQPVIASCIFNITFLIWYTPRIYSETLTNGTLYHVELWAILLTSLLNWWPLIGPNRTLHIMSYPLQMLYAFIDGQPVDIFAFLLVFTEVVFYPQYMVPRSFANFGYTALADQTIGGSLLLIPGLVDLVVMSPLFFRWLGQIEQRAKIEDMGRQEEAEAEAARFAAEEAEWAAAETSDAEA
ncbi:MAG TPA: cytochrome c oxidase assembly protein [Ktedonobacteraceae bacterium]|nr:cytochrome c oxidase assembly protein [Ktedonobacteraceae bacterium]